MADVMNTITYVLTAAGYRTGAASPGRVVSEITEPVVAVNLERLDTEKLTLTARATVVSPVSLGARKCEDEAMKVCKLLQDVGAQCALEPCRLDVKTEVFSVAVIAKFQGNVLGTDWRADYVCRVKFGSVNLHRIVSFSAWRETDKETVLLGGATWKFRVEEHLDGIISENKIADVFTMTVMFEGGKEVYEECELTCQKRVIENGYLLQIWEGTAETRTVTA